MKAGLADLLEDDRATLLGGFLGLRDQLAGLGDDSPADLKVRWRRRGLRAFDADAAARQAGEALPAALPGSRRRAAKPRIP